MSTSLRPDPVIPDHEVLRKIGGGAYGEVWMARSVTGAYRAVKIVRREDFEDERTFEREFEGILKFEPISRDHPGLVNILHVGRSPNRNTFYYYVMELGDDIHGGEKTHTVEYEPRTLRSDIKAAPGKAQALEPCIQSAIRLAEALQHLHENGLSHRDVKPANIIFVNGKARLADIGLVATSGQRTFVGTEGFVPPEGPGSEQADVYSLGKVIYEIVTGKDRLQFPEVPDELHPDSDPKQWAMLNEVLCDICNPQISKRQIKTAEGLATALKNLQQGKSIKKGMHPAYKVMWGVLLCLTCLAGYLTYTHFSTPAKPPVTEDPRLAIITPSDTLGNSGADLDPPDPPEIRYSIVSFVVEPPDADVYTLEDEYLGRVDEIYNGVKLEIGSTVNIVLKKEGYESEEVKHKVKDQAEDFPDFTLKLDQPPVDGEKWWDVLELVYRPADGMHHSGLVTKEIWEEYLDRNIEAAHHNVSLIETSVAKGKNTYVYASKQVADEMAEWLTKQSILEGRLENDFEIIAEVTGLNKFPEITPEMKSNRTLPFRLIVRKIAYASMFVQTVPEGAKIVVDFEFVGISGGEIDKILPGEKVVEIQKEGYKSVTRTVVFKYGEQWKPELIELEKNDSIVWGKKWEKKSGMVFVPLTENVMVSAYELRVKDYQAYVDATEKSMPKPNLNDKPMEPVVFVSYEDAVAYAAWMTTEDREKGLIEPEQSYRIPTDAEWSLMVKLEERSDVGIATKAFDNKDVYPWEDRWRVTKAGKLLSDGDEPRPFGNVSDEIRKKFNTELKHYFKGYDDGNSGTSSVGIYSPNSLGIHDLAGNVSEWVSNTVGENKLRVVRGSNYKTYLVKDLRSSYRTYNKQGKPSDSIGIRLVLEQN